MLHTLLQEHTSTSAECGENTFEDTSDVAAHFLCFHRNNFIAFKWNFAKKCFSHPSSHEIHKCLGALAEVVPQACSFKANLLACKD